jgi:hypothetical protein
MHINMAQTPSPPISIFRLYLWEKCKQNFQENLEKIGVVLKKLFEELRIVIHYAEHRKQHGNCTILGTNLKHLTKMNYNLRIL